MFFDFIQGDALLLMRGTNVTGGWVQRYNVSTGEVGRKCDCCGVEVLACVFVFRAVETAGMAKKYRTNQGWLQSSKLQNLNVKMISGEMNGTEMKWSVGGAKRNR